jgi:hypothetical protein
MFRWALVLALAAVVPLGSARADGGAALDYPFFVILDSDDPADAWRAVEHLEASGCEVVALHGAGTLEGEAPRAAVARLGAAPGVRVALTGPADGALLRASPPAVRQRLDQWNYHLAEVAKRAPLDAPAAGASDEVDAADKAGASLAGGACVVLPSPSFAIRAPSKAAGDLPRLSRYNRAWGAADFQTSEYIYGRIAVAVVTPQTNTQLWSKDELLAAHEAVRQAMDYWRARARNDDVPAKPVFVYLDSLRAERPVLTSSNDVRWLPSIVSSARQRLGVDQPAPKMSIPDPTFTETYVVLNFLRELYKCDWAIMTIVGYGDRFVDAPGLGAYAFLGGPLLVAPLRPARHDLAGLLIHESGHLFYALDEYASGGTSTPCSAMSGYLNIANRNSRFRDAGCAPTTVACTMDTPGRRSCKYTEEMMGIKDSDGDNVPDLFDTQALVQIVSRDGKALYDSAGRSILSDTIDTLTPTLAGYGYDNPLPNRVTRTGTGASDNALTGVSEALGAMAPRPSITMNVLKSIEYRVDPDTTWRIVRPDSSGWDSAVEDFRVTVKGLSGGNHVIEFRATNSAGNATEPRARTKHRLVVQALALRDFALTNEFDGSITVRWGVLGESWDAAGRLYRSEDGGAETLVAEVTQRDNGEHLFSDRSVRPGRRYRYRVESNVFGKTYAIGGEAIASVPIRDAESRLSYASPNPFTSETFLTIFPPEGGISPFAQDDEGNKPPPPPIRPYAPLEPAEAAGATAARLPVNVEVTILDASGRAVRRLVADALPGLRLYTVRWDGRDDDGTPLPAGVYFSRFASGAYVESGKVVLIR